MDVYDYRAFKNRGDSLRQERRSDYIKKTIGLYSKYYDSSQFIIGFYDATSRDPSGLLRALYNHVGAKNIDFNHNVDAKINTAVSIDFPDDFHQYLAEKYQCLIEELAGRYGSYTDDWLSQPGNITEVQRGVGKPLSPVVYP